MPVDYLQVKNVIYTSTGAVVLAVKGEWSSFFCFVLFCFLNKFHTFLLKVVTSDI